MNKFLKFPLLGIIAMALCVGFAACSDDDPVEQGGLDVQKTNIILKYVDDVVINIYSQLADESMSLYNACVALKDNPSQATIDAACQEWVHSRKFWEYSEAFLYGVASDDGIDPHIDSWPLDKAKLDQALANTTLINNMKEYGCNFTGFPADNGLLGFHAVEYMIFRDGEERIFEGGTDTDGVAYSPLTSAELIYCAAVAEDLRNQCILLEASWAGVDNITSAKQAILANAGLAPSAESENYGENMATAGESGNKLYRTQNAALVEILQGAADIADEVGNTKISDPVGTGNVLDVESWYSWNSITDFADNIRGIQYAYLGNIGNSAHSYSVSTYINSLDATMDSNIRAAITTAIDEIEGMAAPFRNNLTMANASSSIDACNNLMDLLLAAIELIHDN